MTQDYWDVYGAVAVFEAIQKLFSHLSNLKNVTCWMFCGRRPSLDPI